MAGVIAMFVAVHGALIAAHLITAAVAGRDDELPGVKKFGVVDNELWRGGGPTAEGYRALADGGVATIVDLRTDRPPGEQHPLFDELGLNHVSLPVRDGQNPNPQQVARLLDIVKRDTGPVFVHCGAGVGRTGSMVAAYRSSRREGRGEIVVDNLAFGVLTIEQLAFSASRWDGEPVPLPARAVSRFFDAPRRIWVHMT